jgi:hypothetical protein
MIGIISRESRDGTDSEPPAIRQ